MGLELSISTSSKNFSLAIVEEKKSLLYYSFELKPRGRTDLTSMLNEALIQLKRKASEIERIYVDIGPGGMSTVRTGVAFANSLSYSLQIPVVPVSSVELMGIELHRKLQKPILCVVNSNRDTCYLAIVEEKVLSMVHGPLEATVRDLCKDLNDFAIAGHHVEEVNAYLLEKKVEKTDCAHAEVEFLITEGELFQDRECSFPNLPTPINENALKIFA